MRNIVGVKECPAVSIYDVEWTSWKAPWGGFLSGSCIKRRFCSTHEECVNRNQSHQWFLLRKCFSHEDDLWCRLYKDHKTLWLNYTNEAANSWNPLGHQWEQEFAKQTRCIRILLHYSKQISRFLRKIGTVVFSRCRALSPSFAQESYSGC